MVILCKPVAGVLSSLMICPVWFPLLLTIQLVYLFFKELLEASLPLLNDVVCCQARLQFSLSFRRTLRNWFWNTSLNTSFIMIIASWFRLKISNGLSTNPSSFQMWYNQMLFLPVGFFNRVVSSFRKKIQTLFYVCSSLTQVSSW